MTMEWPLIRESFTSYSLRSTILSCISVMRLNSDGPETNSSFLEMSTSQLARFITRIWPVIWHAIIRLPHQAPKKQQACNRNSWWRLSYISTSQKCCLFPLIIVTVFYFFIQFILRRRSTLNRAAPPPSTNIGSSVTIRKRSATATEPDGIPLHKRHAILPGSLLLFFQSTFFYCALRWSYGIHFHSDKSCQQFECKQVHCYPIQESPYNL